MTTLCFYRMTDDTGFAPNPFHGYCTVATCTPNHMHARLGQGDYIVGIEGVALRKKRKKKRGQNQSSSDVLCIIYFMKIDEVLTLTKYFDDRRFAKKKNVILMAVMLRRLATTYIGLMVSGTRLRIMDTMATNIESSRIRVEIGFLSLAAFPILVTWALNFRQLSESTYRPGEG